MKKINVTLALLAVFALSAFGKGFVTLEASLSKGRISLGDSVEVTLRLYADVDVSGMEYVEPFTVDGAYWRNASSGSFVLDDTTYCGKKARKVDIGRFVLVPMQPGTVEVKPVKVHVRWREQKPDADPFLAFFDDEDSFFWHDTLVATRPMYLRVDGTAREAGNRGGRSGVYGGVEMVVDRSGSLMVRRGKDEPTFRQMLDGVFLDMLPEVSDDSQVGITVFAAQPRYLADDGDYADADILLKEHDGSAVYDAVLAAALRGGGDKSVMLFADGPDNSSCVSLNTLRDILVSRGVRVDVVAFGCDDDSLLYAVGDSVNIYGGTVGDSVNAFKIKNICDLSALKALAEATGGEYVRVSSPADVKPATVRAVAMARNRKRPEGKPREGFAPDATLLDNLFCRIRATASQPLKTRKQE